jgi:alpha-amylase
MLGLEQHLDYIQSMGFDAIWITPVVQNIDHVVLNWGMGDVVVTGYHGYWQQNLYSIDSNFGGAQALHSLVQAMHSRRMWLMLDVVANHMGDVRSSALSNLVPFNTSEHFHVEHDECDTTQVHNQTQLEQTWFCNLPDIDTEQPAVASTLYQWIHRLVGTYAIDGVRIDTLRFVRQDFWPTFESAAAVFCIGEVGFASGEYPDYGLTYTAGYQRHSISGVLNYPLYYVIQDLFVHKKSMSILAEYWPQHEAAFSDPDALGNFVDNHDQARFLFAQPDISQLQNALTLAFCARGIPIVYATRWLLRLLSFLRRLNSCEREFPPCACVFSFAS